MELNLKPKYESVPLVRPFLGNTQEILDELSDALDSRILSNFGPWHEKLREALQAHFAVSNFNLVSNATVGLELVFKAFHLQGDVITSPFSFIATASSIAWSGLNPVFCDIDSHTLNINPDEIERLITSRTCAISTVHTFGNICKIERIESIAKRHGLKVIYDAAHCFDVRENKTGDSVVKYGDASVMSFHATKTFNTIEGGGIYFKDLDIANIAKKITNFGISTPSEITYLGTNAKLSEVHALIGYNNLLHINNSISKRRVAVARYKQNLKNVSEVSFQNLNPEYSEPVSYMPILFKNESILLRTMANLQELKIGCRRYFYPSLNQLSFLVKEKSVMPCAEDVSRRILCLPLHQDLELDAIDYVCEVVEAALN